MSTKQPAKDTFISEELIVDPEKDNRYNDIVKLACHLCGTPIAGISLLSEKGFVLQSKIGLELTTVSNDDSFWKYNEGERTFQVVDAKKDSRFQDNRLVISGPKIRFYCGTGLRDQNDKVIGVLYVIDKKPRELSFEQIDLLESLAKQVELLINSRRKVSELEETTRQLQEAQSRIKSNEAYYQSILDSAGDMLWELDENGKFIYVNKLLEQTTGYSKEQLHQMYYWQLVEKSKVKQLMDFYQNQMNNQEEYSYNEFPIINYYHESLWIGLKVRMLFDGKKVSKVIAIARDITKQKHFDQQLQKYKNGLRLLNEIASNVKFSVEEQVNLALEVGRNYLGLDVGVVGSVNEDIYRIKYSNVDKSSSIRLKEDYTLDEVFGSITYQLEKVVAIPNIKRSKYSNYECYNTHQIESYIGTPYYFKGQKKGTISFFSLNSRAPFDEQQLDFIQLLSRWIGFTLEREKNQNLLLTEQDMLKAFASFSPAAIAMFNTDMEYIAATAKWYVENDLEGIQVIGKNHYDISPGVKEEWKGIHKRALAGEVISSEEDSYLDRTNKTRYLKWEVRPWYNTENEIGGIILFTEDITSKKKQELELKRAKEDAEKASQGKDQFLSTMSHEIRTPLNAVIGASHLLLQENPRDDQKQNLVLLKNSGEHLLALVNDILDFSKIEEGKLKLESVPFNLSKMLESIKYSMQYAADDKNISLIWEVEDAPDQTLVGDPTRINQILINLLSNAIKFTEKGFVKLLIKSVSSSERDIKLYFEVEDSGIGISRKQQKAIFETFTQADEDTTRKYGGSGLGLTITRKLLEMMGSSIHVESIANEGSKFFFTVEFPLSDSKLIPIQKGADENLLENVSNKNILLVEDHEVNRILATKFLTKWGLNVDTAENGKICLDKIESRKYALILMDLQMPEMDGYEATTIIRSKNDPYFKELPILALTAAAIVEAKQRVNEVGMNDFVTKPFNPNQFKEKLIKHLVQSAI
ncbi:MAG: PAS domain S-box protein [bacterium]|nr:PAS domain S-box protein [bacterium]